MRSSARSAPVRPGSSRRSGSRFGDVLHLSDIVQTLMAVDGVENASVNRFKRVGPHWPDESWRGGIVLSGIEIASCDNDDAQPESGYYSLVLHGGRTG